jgi:predicted N-acetyltransferase YhbS
LREEQAADRAAVATLIARTYQTTAVQVIELASQLRHLEGAVGLVGELAGAASAYTLLVPVTITGEATAALLAPIAVDMRQEELDFDGWLTAVKEAAQQRGVRYLLLHGEIDAFTAQGFVPAAQHQLTGQTAGLLACDLATGDAAPQGGVITLPSVLQG